MRQKFSLLQRRTTERLVAYIVALLSLLVWKRRWYKEERECPIFPLSLCSGALPTHPSPQYCWYLFQVLLEKIRLQRFSCLPAIYPINGRQKQYENSIIFVLSRFIFTDTTGYYRNVLLQHCQRPWLCLPGFHSLRYLEGHLCGVHLNVCGQRIPFIFDLPGSQILSLRHDQE